MSIEDKNKEDGMYKYSAYNLYNIREGIPEVMKALKTLSLMCKLVDGASDDDHDFQKFYRNSKHFLEENESISSKMGCTVERYLSLGKYDSIYFNATMDRVDHSVSVTKSHIDTFINYDIVNFIEEIPNLKIDEDKTEIKKHVELIRADIDRGIKIFDRFVNDDVIRIKKYGKSMHDDDSKLFKMEDGTVLNLNLLAVECENSSDFICSNILNSINRARHFFNTLLYKNKKVLGEK